MVRKSEHERRSDLIAATIREIAAVGSLNVTTSQIAKSAGVSSGLAFHYFKDKDSLFLAAMRDILWRHGQEARSELKKASTPRDRLKVMAHISFGSTNFHKETVSAWLNFYTLALKSAEARRLLYVYQRRLHSNLVSNLRPIIGGHAPDVARRIAGLIDGLYLRYALDKSVEDGSQGAEHVMHAIDSECVQIRTNQQSLMESADPSPMNPIAKMQE